MYTTEFQKHGLPHMHLLVFLQLNHKIHDALQADTIISAQIPDKDVHPKLYETVAKCMIHGPCGPEHPNSACRVDGNCSKHYTQEFTPETHFGDNGYPQYARPNNGRTYTNSRHQTFDNRNVIPYNPYLSYQCRDLFTSTFTRGQIKLHYKLGVRLMKSNSILMLDILDL
jgi:hypothetical protein